MNVSALNDKRQCQIRLKQDTVQRRLGQDGQGEGVNTNQSFPSQIVCNAGSDLFSFFNELYQTEYINVYSETVAPHETAQNVRIQAGRRVTSRNQMGNTLSGTLTGILRARKGLI